MRSRNTQYVAGVDHLRAFAAILIVFYHGLHLFNAHAAGGDESARYVRTTNPLFAIVCEGHTAVGLFMVLSGFIFAYGSRDHEIAWLGFLRNRCLRILPLMVALAAVGIYAFPQSFSLAGLLQHAALLSNLPGAAPMGPFNLMFWTIAVEFQFYLIFPFLLRFVRAGGVRYVAGAIALAIILRGVAVVHGANPRDLAYWTIVGRVDQFLLGILLGLRFEASEMQSARARIVLVALAALAAITMLFAFHRSGGGQAVKSWKIVWPTIEGAVWAMFIGAYLNAADLVRPRLSAVLCGIGTLSFSIYMTHRIVIDTLTVVNWTTSLGALASTALLALPITLALSALTYSVIEKPFLALRGSYRRRSEPEENEPRPPLRLVA